jgi:hypothetical protein
MMNQCTETRKVPNFSLKMPVFDQYLRCGCNNKNVAPFKGEAAAGVKFEKKQS